MIKKISLENTFGIKELEIDFQLKSIRESSKLGLEDQVIKKNGEYFSLIPTFLAKNAAGKTSLIKAIEFAMRFSSKNRFVSEITFLALNMIGDKLKSASNTSDTDTFSIAGMGIQSLRVIDSLFRQISFAGSHSVSMLIELINNQSIKVELTRDTFYIVMNNSIINVGNILSQLQINDLSNKTGNQIKDELTIMVKNIAKEYEFISEIELTKAIFRDTNPKSLMAEMMVKNKVEEYLQTIQNKFGFEAAKLLLQKVDKNIKTIKFDTETKTMDIYLKTTGENISITSNNLSFGTQKLLEILYLSIDLFEKGGILMIDEIENGLHLSLIKLIVAFYTDPEINKGKAQLLFTTHNPLIAEQEIIEHRNMFLQEGSSFINIRNINIQNKRTEDQQQILRAKNFYSDVFWSKNNLEDKATLSNLAINQIINLFSNDGDIWQRK